MKITNVNKLGGVFTFKHYKPVTQYNVDELTFDDLDRIEDIDGSPYRLTWSDKNHNLFVDQGLVYALNVAFGQSVGGTPPLINAFFIGLSKIVNPWTNILDAASVHVNTDEMELYDESARPQWSPNALGIPGAIEVSDTGAEVTYTISDLGGGSETIYGAFLINSAPKDGSSDATATLIAGSDFTSSRILVKDDVFKVGYILKAQAA